MVKVCSSSILLSASALIEYGWIFPLFCEPAGCNYVFFNSVNDFVISVGNREPNISLFCGWGDMSLQVVFMLCIYLDMCTYMYAPFIMVIFPVFHAYSVHALEMCLPVISIYGLLKWVNNITNQMRWNGSRGHFFFNNMHRSAQKSLLQCTDSWIHCARLQVYEKWAIAIHYTVHGINKKKHCSLFRSQQRKDLPVNVDFAIDQH